MSNLLKSRQSARSLILLLGFMAFFSHRAFASNVVAIVLPVGSYYTHMSADITVPKEAPPSGTAFIWTGLEPNRADPGPIGLGVLQPTLSYGDSCQLPGHNSFWYVNATYHIRAARQGSVVAPPLPPGIAGTTHYKCPGSPAVTVDQGEKLKTVMSYDSTTQEWNMTITAPKTDSKAKRDVAFKKKLSVKDVPQRQVLALLFFEPVNGATLKNKIEFTDIVLKATHSDAVTKPVICASAPPGCSGASSTLKGHVETCKIKKCVVN